MQITIADIDRLNPPAEAADLIRDAAEAGHTLWAGWQRHTPARTFGLRVDGPGWDIVAMWGVPRESAPYLASVLIYEDATKEWALVDLDEARRHVANTA